MLTHLHTYVISEIDREWHEYEPNQQVVVQKLKAAGFRARYGRSLAAGASLLRVEWGRNAASTPLTVADLASSDPNTVAQLRSSGLCRKVPRSLKASKFYDPSLTVLTPEAVLERARDNTVAPVVAITSVGDKAVERLRQQGTVERLNRLSQAAKDVETESALSSLDTVIASQRKQDDSLHDINSLLTEINKTSKDGGTDPLAALEKEISKGPVHRQLREVEALIDEVDMAATPNTRRKNAAARKAVKDASDSAAARSTAVTTETREPSVELEARARAAKAQADAIFAKETKRMEQEAETSRQAAEAAAEAERQALIRQVEAAEAETEKVEASAPLKAAGAVTPSAAAVEQSQLKDERALRAEAEAADRRLHEAARLAEKATEEARERERREAEAARLAEEERAAAELRAELDLKGREAEALTRAAELKHQEQVARTSKRIEAPAEVDERAVEAAKKEAEAALAKQKAATESARATVAAAAPKINGPIVSDDALMFTPISVKSGGGGGANALDTPATVFGAGGVKDELNIDSLLGSLDLDLDTTHTRGAPVNNKNLKTPAASTLPRDSGVSRELEGLDEMMAGISVKCPFCLKAFFRL